MSSALYDFRKPARLPRHVEERLAAWFGLFCKLAPPRWAGYFPYPVELNSQAIESIQPDAALARLPDTLVGFRISIDKSTSLLVLPRPLMLAFLGGLLGEAGGELPADRELSPVEESLAHFWAETLVVGILRESWTGPDALEIGKPEHEPRVKYTRVFGHGQTAVVVTLGVRGPFDLHSFWWILEQESLLRLLAPSKDLEQAAARPHEWRTQLESVVRRLPLEVSVSLGQAELPVGIATDLHEGDLIVLNQKVSEPLTAFIAGRSKLRVWPGRVGAQQAVQIEASLEG